MKPEGAKGMISVPDYYAHLCFGRRVLELLPKDVRSAAENGRAAYEYGLFGPDPLFFYKPARREPARLAAYAAHHKPGREMLGRMLAPAADGEPFAMPYALGLSCHFALDSACHPYIQRRGKRGDISHIALEAEFDRMLMERNGIDAMRVTPQPHPDMPEEFYAAAARAHEYATAEIMREAFAAFYKYSHLFTKVNGTPLRIAVNVVGTVFPGCSNAKGLILGKKPAAPVREINEKLDALLEENAQRAAAAVCAFYASAAGRTELPDMFDADFYGAVKRRPLAEPADARA
jgi:hypothetical protein